MMPNDPRNLRELIRRKEWSGLTAGLAGGFVQAGVAIIPKDIAFDFMLFCQRNPKPFPILDVTELGCPEARFTAPGSDLRTDLPKYRVYSKGVLEAEVLEISDYWRDDFVGFVLGCSFSFEEALLRAGIPVRNIEEKKNAPIYVTNRQCVPAGIFKGPLAVSMRPIPAYRISDAVRITARTPSTHGAPVHVGVPEALGIVSMDRPDFGDVVTIRDNELPVFWACSVTLQVVAAIAKPEILITQAPGHMFITDIRDEDLVAW